MNYDYNDLVFKWEKYTDKLCELEEFDGVKTLIGNTTKTIDKLLNSGNPLPDKCILIYKYVAKAEYFFTYDDMYLSEDEKEEITNDLDTLCRKFEEYYEKA